MEDTSKKTTHKPSKKRTVANVVITIFSVLFIAAGGVFLYANNLLSRYNYISENPKSLTGMIGGAVLGNNLQKKPLPNGEPCKINGLYHDDMIYNILLLGVDDYKPNDPGRSDSMMLVSLDRRHKKLKFTSFMRDMYVPIPGYRSSRINSAYSIGGAPLITVTIEKVFGCDIDKYVIVDFKAFPKIIDALGGVTVKITAAEADQINKHSWENGKYSVSAGTCTLTGKQARYYSRIRKNLGDDYARTQRQRNIISSLVKKFKSADLNQLIHLANDILPNVYSNMSPDELLQIVLYAPTYMNYPMKEDRIPADGMFKVKKLLLNPTDKYPSSVLVIDKAKNRQQVNNFIYENDFPETSKAPKPNKDGDYATEYHPDYSEK